MADDTQLAIAPDNDRQGAMEVRSQVNQIQYLMQSVLKEGEHYGVVPGTGKNAKPSLFQSGAEKIAYMFHLVPRYEVMRAELGNGHREYEVHCTLTSRDTGEVVGFGMGTCTTLESKYRYRNQWSSGQKTRVENPDIADTWNTVMKMAKKRAFVDAVKSTTAASDIFTQDVEDMPQFQQQPQQYAQQQPAQAQQPAQQPSGPEEPDMVWIGRQAGALSGVGYDAVQVSDYLLAQWRQGGRAAAEGAVAQMQGSARQAAQEVESVVEEAI